MKEHLSCHQSLSALSEHKLTIGHQFHERYKSPRLSRELVKEKNQKRLTIQGKPSLNRGISHELPSVMLQLVSHDEGHMTLLKKT